MLKSKHTGVYYKVSGKRRVEVQNEKGELIGTKILKERTRFEALYIQNAEAFATEVYKREGIMCDIHEVQR